VLNPSECPIGWLRPELAGRGQSDARLWDSAWHSMATEAAKAALSAGRSMRANGSVIAAAAAPDLLHLESAAVLRASGEVSSWIACSGSALSAYEAYVNHVKSI